MSIYFLPSTPENDDSIVGLWWEDPLQLPVSRSNRSMGIIPGETQPIIHCTQHPMAPFVV